MNDEAKNDGEIKLDIQTDKLTDEPKEQLKADFKTAQEHDVLKNIALRPKEIDVRELDEKQFRQLMFRYMAETEELLIAIAQSSNDLLLSNVERLSPKQKDRYEKIVNNREEAFKKEAEAALAAKKSN